jgi:hypothetical protein
VRIEGDTVRVTFDAQPGTEIPQRRRQVLEVGLVARRTDVDVDSGVAGVVEAGGDASDDDEGHVVVLEDATDGDDVVVVELRRRHW